MAHDSSLERLLLLGRNHLTYGDYACMTTRGMRAACAISVGEDPRTPGLAAKGDPTVPNEDALLVIDEGDHVLMAVADAHFGWQASHEIITAIANTSDSVPATPSELERLLDGLPTDAEPTESASTLLLAVHDRRHQQGFGLSFGDSSLMLVGSPGARNLNVRNVHYVAAHAPESYRPEQGYGFQFLSEPGQLVLAFSDGINECHYASPQTSVTPSHLHQLFASIGPHPEPYARRLVEMALAGVDGNPGGQDNIALVVSRT